MTSGQPYAVLKHIRRFVGARSARHVSDRVLLDRFLERNDEAAFASLVERHGSMVLGVCRRVLRNAHDAEDAYQATFLVLARRARSIHKKDSLGSWLHGVAFRMSSNLKKAMARKRAVTLDEIAGPDTSREASWQEAQAIVDEELNRLAEKHRAPLVLCYLEGRSRDEAALQLGCKLGTLRTRLERARELLRARLLRRGLAPSVILLSAAFTETASAIVPATLALSTVKAASLAAIGKSIPGVSSNVICLAEGLMKAMSMSGLKSMALLAVVVLVLGFGGALLVRQGEAAEQLAGDIRAQVSESVNQKRPKEKKEPAAWAEGSVVTGRVVDHQGLPVPNAEVLLLGEERIIVDAKTRKWFVRSTEKGKLPDPASTRTTQNGDFTIERKTGPANRLGVISSDPLFWVVPRRTLPQGDNVVIKLPASGSLAVHCDLPGKANPQPVEIELVTFDDVDWRVDMLRFHASEVSVQNPGDTMFEYLPPARFSVERGEMTRIGQRETLWTPANRQLAKIESNKRSVVRIERKVGRPLTGQVRGLEKVGLRYAHVRIGYFGPEEGPSKYGGRYRTFTGFDVIPITADGRFTTDPIPPGKYELDLFALRSDTPHQSPQQSDFSGRLQFTIPEQGDMPKVEIIAKPR